MIVKGIQRKRERERKREWAPLLSKVGWGSSCSWRWIDSKAAVKRPTLLCVFFRPPYPLCSSPRCFSSRKSNPPPLPVTTPLPLTLAHPPILFPPTVPSRRNGLLRAGRSSRPEVLFARSALIEGDLFFSPSFHFFVPPELRVHKETKCFFKTEISFLVTVIGRQHPNS